MIARECACEGRDATKAKRILSKPNITTNQGGIGKDKGMEEGYWVTTAGNMGKVSDYAYEDQGRG